MAWIMLISLGKIAGMAEFSLRKPCGSLLWDPSAVLLLGMARRLFRHSRFALSIIHANMKVPDSYVQAGFTMKLVRREGDVVMYSDSIKSYFEVHLVRLRGPEKIRDKEYPRREVLAGNEDFGKYAFACTSQDR